MKLEKYTKNLEVRLINVFSYDTLVAEIDYNTKTVITNGKYNATTTKHINYVAKVLNFKVQK